jgi:hypothetical protein
MDLDDVAPPGVEVVGQVLAEDGGAVGRRLVDAGEARRLQVAPEPAGLVDVDLVDLDAR